MPQAKYEDIYLDIRKQIISGDIPYGDFLPSENNYAQKYNCTRNTIRRALSILTSEGLLLPRHGKGVQVIYRNLSEQNVFTIGGIESFKEATDRNQRKITTKMIFFKEVTCDEQMSLTTGFDIGEQLYYIERIRQHEGKSIIFDTNIFLKSETEGLNKKIIESSIYAYLENTLGMTITTSKRRITAEKATQTDKTLLDLDSFDFVMVVTGQVFNSKGVMFEYTQSRHKPDQVCFIENAVRQKK